MREVPDPQERSERVWQARRVRGISIIKIYEN